MATHTQAPPGKGSALLALHSPGQKVQPCTHTGMWTRAASPRQLQAPLPVSTSPCALLGQTRPPQVRDMIRQASSCGLGPCTWQAFSSVWAGGGALPGSPENLGQKPIGCNQRSLRARPPPGGSPPAQSEPKWDTTYPGPWGRTPPGRARSHSQVTFK